MDELLTQFLIEGRDLVGRASDDLAVLVRDPRAAGAIDSAFRAIHTLKGSVGIFPMGPAERVLHAAEDILERARKGVLALDRETVGTLIACIDAVDRWIDDVERAGGVDEEEAEHAGSALIDRLPVPGGANAARVASPSNDWVEPLAAREAATIAAATGTLVAIRYVPDADSFFRGDDPLAVVAAVPELVALSILPAGDGWPALDAIEPFGCISILECLSSAPIEAVAAAFRLVSDQVRIHVIEPVAATVDTVDAAEGVLRVEAARINALVDSLGELVVAVNALAPVAADAERIDRKLSVRLRATQSEIETRVGDLRRRITRVRLVPLASTLRRLPRMAREIASALGKPVTFSVSGETLEVDKQIADSLFEPLLHLVRNALDHGIEDAAERHAAGKPDEGSVSLAARRDGDMILVKLTDDGAGIDPVKLRNSAVARGLLTLEAAAEMDDHTALRLIFAAGFSTAARTTEISGRGVGMDAVQAAVNRMRGTIDIDSVIGRGTSFQLRLPANALTTRLLVVGVGEDRYGVALDQIVETVRVDADRLVPVGDGLACILRGKTVPVLSVATLLGTAQKQSANAKLLVTRSDGQRVALRVDSFSERLDTVVRPSSGILGSLRGVSGSALLGDGSVLLVLNLPELAA